MPHRFPGWGVDPHGPLGDTLGGGLTKEAIDPGMFVDAVQGAPEAFHYVLENPELFSAGMGMGAVAKTPIVNLTTRRLAQTKPGRWLGSKFVGRALRHGKKLTPWMHEFVATTASEGAPVIHDLAAMSGAGAKAVGVEKPGLRKLLRSVRPVVREPRPGVHVPSLEVSPGLGHGADIMNAAMPRVEDPIRAANTIRNMADPLFSRESAKQVTQGTAESVRDLGRWARRAPYELGSSMTPLM